MFPPTFVGGLVGAAVVSRLDDDAFERLFGFLMIPILVLALWPSSQRSTDDPWPTWLTMAVFFGVGVYAGAIQAGVGLLLLMVLAGQDTISCRPT